MGIQSVPTTPWVLPEEHEYVVSNMVRYNLIKTSKKGKLPLKNGTETDIYANLRNMRSSPDAMDFLTALYSRALQQLDIQRFAEVPQAVSGLAALIATFTRIPYITIRTEIKEGRATDASVIGDSYPGEHVLIIDDVITNGESKIAPYLKCHELGLNVLGIVVLIDRQEGWERVFAENNIQTQVWAGMTLQEVRDQLVHLGQL